MNQASELGQSLQRKLGPLPVWIWALVAGIGLYVIRSRMGGGANTGTSSADRTAAVAAESQLVTAEGAARASTLQSPMVLQPGESVFDPNSGFLSGAAGSNGNGDQSALIGLIGTLATAPTPAPAAASGGGTRAPKGYHYAGHSGRFVLPTGSTDKLVKNAPPRSKTKSSSKHTPSTTKPGKGKK